MQAVPPTVLLTASSAWAALVKVAEVGDTAYHADSESVSSDGNFHRVSVIHDYAHQEAGGVRSRRVSYQIDCTGERLRSLSATEHSEPTAQGKQVSSWQRESDWLYVAPRTGSNLASRAPYGAIVKFVCRR